MLKNFSKAKNKIEPNSVGLHLPLSLSSFSLSPAKHNDHIYAENLQFVSHSSLPLSLSVSDL